MPKLSNEQVAQAAEILSQLEPGFLPEPLFLQITRLAAVPAIELVPLRMHEGRVQVLLIAREEDDPTWPGMVHAPGTIIRASDESYDQALGRLIESELSGVALASRPVFVYAFLNRSLRGREASQIFYVEVLGDPPVGAFYDVEAFPANMIESHLAFIRKAAEAFGAAKTQDN